MFNLAKGMQFSSVISTMPDQEDDTTKDDDDSTSTEK